MQNDDTAPTPAVIGLCGYAGCGKDTVAGMVIDATNGTYRQVAFADGVRAFARALDATLVNEHGEHESYTSILGRHGGYDTAKRRVPSIREYLVKIGHGARTALSSSVWIDACLPPTKARPESPLVISDCRYYNEARRVLDCGGEVWFIERAGVDAANDTERASIDEVRRRLVDDSAEARATVLRNDTTLGALRAAVTARLAATTETAM